MIKKQHKIQLTLASFGLFLILITYFYYPNSAQDKLFKDKSFSEDVEKTSDNNKSTNFENVEYKGLYNLNKPFTLKSKKAHILNEEPDIVYMNNINATLYLDNKRIVTIVAKQGKYNKITYDCWFSGNVVATDGETKILADNLDLIATNSFVEIYNNVNLYYATNSLQADKIDYNFESKYFTISMFDDKSVKMKVFQ